MKYTNVRNPSWANPERSSINCEVIFEGLGNEYLPFTAVPSGDYPHTHKIYAECLDGKYGPIAEYSSQQQV